SGLAGFQALSWHGVVAPAGTPDAVVARLNEALGGALAAPAVRQRLMEEGAQASNLHTAAFTAFIGQEIAAWAQAVKDSGATAN
ncbi:tripartite tricarboxylate transporter substrate-binding protein, partial [Achromobacter insuavis]